MYSGLKINFKRYGKSVYINDNDWNSNVYYAFIQPLRYKNKMYMIGNFTEIGHYGEGYYLYVGPADIVLKRLSSGAVIITADNKKYNIFRNEIVYAYGKPLYTWAIIREKT